jgi:hypothetical protein
MILFEMPTISTDVIYVLRTQSDVSIAFFWNDGSKYTNVFFWRAAVDTIRGLGTVDRTSFLGVIRPIDRNQC